MKIYRSVKSFLCTPINRNINVGTMVAEYESIRKLVIVFNVGEKGIEYTYSDFGNSHSDFQSVTKWFCSFKDNTEYFVYDSTQAEDDYGNVVTPETWMNGLSNANMRQMSDGSIQLWDFGKNAWVIPVLIDGVMEYHDIE